MSITIAILCSFVVVSSLCITLWCYMGSNLYKNRQRRVSATTRIQEDRVSINDRREDYQSEVLEVL